MKFQDSSFNGLKVTVGIKSVTHARTHPRTHARSKSNMPHQLFQSWGHKNEKKEMSRVMRKPAKTKTRISCALTTHLISAIFFCYMDSTINLLIKPKTLLWFTAHFVSYLVGNPKDRFSHDPLELTITKTSPCNEYPLTPHFCKEKLGFTGVYICFLIFALLLRRF